MTPSDAFDVIMRIVRVGMICVLLSALASPFTDRSVETHEPPARSNQSPCADPPNSETLQPPTCGWRGERTL